MFNKKINTKQMIAKKNLSSFLLFISLLIVIFNSANTIFGLIFFLTVMIFSINFSKNHKYLLPFYIYPFMFVIQNQDAENILIKLLPDLTMIIAIIFFLLKRKIHLYQINLYFFLLLFAFLICFSSYFHIMEVIFIPALLRQYILPVLFLVIFINESLNKNELPFEALKICIYSFSIISIIALLNYYSIIDIIAVNSTLGLRPSFFCQNEFTANLFNCNEFGKGQRLDPLVSGSVGSAAAISFMLGLVSIFLSNKNNKHLKYFSIPLILSSILTLSVSILFPIIYFALIILLKYKNFFKISIISFILVSFLVFTNLSLFGEKSGYDYLNSTILKALSEHFTKIDASAILFGSGPIIFSNRFKYFPENFIVDVGILRVFLENGLLIFVIFAAILFYLIKMNYWLAVNLPSNYNRSLLYIFLVLISLVHSNWFITPPFMIIFIIIISGIVVQYKLSKMNLNFK